MAKLLKEVEAVGVTGHQELPEAAIRLLSSRLDDLFPDASNVLIISSLAAGADSLVAEKLIASGASLRAIIPCRNYEDTFSDDSARRRFERLLAKAASAEVLPFDAPSESAFLEAGYRMVSEAASLVAVWDGKPARGLGGTADIVARARRDGKPVQVIWPAGLER